MAKTKARETNSKDQSEKDINNSSFEFFLRELFKAHKIQVRGLEKKIENLAKSPDVRSVEVQTDFVCKCSVDQIVPKPGKTNLLGSSKSPVKQEDGGSTKLSGSQKSERNKLSLKKNSKLLTNQCDFSASVTIGLNHSKNEYVNLEMGAEKHNAEERKNMYVPETMPMSCVDHDFLGVSNIEILEKNDETTFIPDSLENDISLSEDSSNLLENKGETNGFLDETDEVHFAMPRSKSMEDQEAKIDRSLEISDDVTNFDSTVDASSLSMLANVLNHATDNRLQINRKNGQKLIASGLKNSSNTQPEGSKESSTKPKAKNLKFTTKYNVELEPPNPKRNKVKLVQTKLYVKRKKISDPDTKEEIGIPGNKASAENTNYHANGNVSRKKRKKHSAETFVDLDETCAEILEKDDAYVEPAAVGNIDVPDEPEIQVLPPKEQIADTRKDDKRGLQTESNKKTQITHKPKENILNIVPSEKVPNYKYKEECVRKKDARSKLPGHDCQECEKYYSNLGLPEDQKQKRIQECSRHRARYKAPATPAHFWELDFPDTQECKERGYTNQQTQKISLKTRRRRV